MERLFHAFARPRHSVDANTGTVVRTESTPRDYLKGFEILKLILRHGLLCTPEDLPLFADASTERQEKRDLLNRNEPYAIINQSRACFTLMESHELALQYQLVRQGNTSFVSHSELFGSFAIGLDSIQSRELGVLPTVYYYRNADRGRISAIEGLGYQIVHRLDEISTVFSILSYIEARATSTAYQVPSAEVLERIGIKVSYEDRVLEQLSSLSQRDASRVLKLFDTDRVAAWNIVDFVKMLLSLYQTVDSTIEYAPLAFFRQREWRLIHHMCQGMTWFSLGDNPELSDPSQSAFEEAASEIRDFVSSHASERARANSLDTFRRSWLLHSAGKRHFRDFVREIVVPRDYVGKTVDFLQGLRFESRRPEVIELAPVWRLGSDPRISAG